MPFRLPAACLLLLPLLAATALTAGCGSGAGAPPPGELPKVSACATGDGPPITISGTVLYERLALGPAPAGLGALQTRPARFVDVDVRLAGGGACQGRGSTDASGAYSITLMPTPGETLEVAVFSRTLEDPDRDLLVHEALPPFANAHSEIDVFSFASGPVGTVSQTVDVTVPYTSGPPNRPSIGFAVLDTAITCWDTVTAAIGTALPTSHFYTSLGNNFDLNDTSSFRPNARAVAILGGAAGNPDGSDTDYFDDAVVAHEFFHFVEDVISHTMTRGGFHGGEPLEPGFAWSEGLATGYGCLCLANSEYIDTTGPGNPPLFTLDIENVTSFDPPGIGGEFTVAEILWDLGDGGAGPADVDGDTASVPVADLITALDSFDPASDGPYVGLLLDRVVNAPGAAIDAAGMAALLAGPPENQGISYPLAGADVWPIPIAVGGADTGTLDSLAGPGKSQCRGITSTAWYHLVLPAGALVSINLTITPIAGSGDNLDLYLHANQDVATPIAASLTGGAAAESINVPLAAGTYVIRVEAPCGGAGNRASYSLTVN